MSLLEFAVAAAIVFAAFTLFGVWLHLTEKEHRDFMKGLDEDNERR